jgi:hypothetical protein
MPQSSVVHGGDAHAQLASQARAESLVAATALALGLLIILGATIVRSHGCTRYVAEPGYAGAPASWL